MKHLKKETLAVGLIALVIGIGLGYGGEKTLAKPAGRGGGAAAFAAMGSRTGAASGGFARAGGAGGGMGGGLLSGTVAQASAGSLTLDTRDGSSHVVLITPSTTVSKSVSGSMSDIAQGDTVIVSGTTGADGSVSASNIQLRPAGSAPASSGQ